MARFEMSDKTFDRINKVLVLIITCIIVYPLIFVMSASISDPAAVAKGKMWLWPVDVTLDGYKLLFKNPNIWIGYKNTIIYTFVGTVIHLALLLPCAYALSRRDMVFKRTILFFVLFTMLFNGGLIPLYLVVQALGMLDTMWSIVIPGVLGAWSILVTKAFFEQTIPDQLIEASKIDGASEFYLFFKIVLPLSLPIVAVMALFHGVSLWNQYFSALIYLSDEAKYPLQLILRQILIFNEMGTDIMSSDEAGSYADKVATAAIVKYAVIIVSSLPLLIIYPFLQRFFVKGVLIGSVKE